MSIITMIAINKKGNMFRLNLNNYYFGGSSDYD